MSEVKDKKTKTPKMTLIGCNRYGVKKNKKLYEILYNRFCKGWNAIIRDEKDPLLYRTVVYKCKTKEEAAEKVVNLNIK